MEVKDLNISKVEVGSVQFLEQVQKVHEQLLDGLNYIEINDLQDDPIALNLYFLQQIENLIIEKKLLPQSEISQELVRAIFDEVTGFGPLAPLLRDESITDIYVNSADTVYVERKGRIEKTDIRFLNNDHVFKLVQRVASKSGRHLDLGTPYFDARLKDGTRIHAIIPPVALDGIKVSLRKFMFQKFDIGSLVQAGALTADMAQLLQLAVKSRFNIAICGGTGSGKTTLLNSLLTSIRSGERIITIEDTPELVPAHHHTVRLLTRPPNPEGKGGVSQADLMVNALRMRPDRVILGELRGAEAFNLLHAMNTGQDGSMVTLHASGAEEVIARLLNMILMAGVSLSVESIKQQIANALDLVVHVSRLINGSRRVMSISQVSTNLNGDLIVEEIYHYHIHKITTEELDGIFEQFQIPPTKRNKNKLITAGLLNDYLSIFKK